MPLYRRPGSPHWWIRISISGRKTRRTTGTADREQAEEFEQRERERLWRLHKLGDRGAVRWKEVTARYLADSARPRKRDREIIARLAEDLDQEAVSAIDTDALEEVRKDLLEDGLARSTIDRFMRTVSAVLHKCMDWRILQAVPAIPMYNPPRGEPRWLTKTEFERLRKQLPRHLALAAQFAVLTGLRMRSMLALTWDRIDLKAARAWIPGEQMKAGMAHGLPLSPEAVTVLRKLKTASPRGAHVFQYENAPIANLNTKAFRKAAGRAKVAPLRWHDLRHTFAAWAVQGGVSLQELMQLGGWRSYQMALRYGHLAPDHLASAAAKVSTKRGTVRKAARGK